MVGQKRYSVPRQGLLAVPRRPMLLVIGIFNKFKAYPLYICHGEA